jgi:hypothetical protein
MEAIMIRRSDSGPGDRPVFAGAVFVAAFVAVFFALAVFVFLRAVAAPFNPTTESVAAQSESAWAWDCIACSEVANPSPQRALAIDKAGKVHVAFGGEKVIYTHEAGGTWRRDVIDELGSFYHVTLVLEALPEFMWLTRQMAGRMPGTGVLPGRATDVGRGW